jgi:hypothetical protein
MRVILKTIRNKGEEMDEYSNKEYDPGLKKKIFKHVLGAAFFLALSLAIIYTVNHAPKYGPYGNNVENKYANGINPHVLVDTAKTDTTNQKDITDYLW